MNYTRPQTTKSKATFFGVGQGYGRLATAAQASPDSPPADTAGSVVPPPDEPDPDTGGGTVPTPRQLLRQKMLQVIQDDAEDDPDEMAGGDNVAQARMREQTRCAAIMGSSAAKGRKNYAGHLAFNTRLTREEAINLLERAPIEASAGNAYQSAIDGGWDKTNAVQKAREDRHGQNAGAVRTPAIDAQSRRAAPADDPYGWDAVAGGDEPNAKRKH